MKLSTDCLYWSCLDRSSALHIQPFALTFTWQPRAFFLLSDLAELVMLTAPAALPALFLLQFTPRSQHHRDLWVTFSMAMAMPNPSSVPPLVSPRWEMRQKVRVCGVCVWPGGGHSSLHSHYRKLVEHRPFWGNAISWDFISCHRVGTLCTHLLLA